MQILLFRVRIHPLAKSLCDQKQFFKKFKISHLAAVFKSRTDLPSQISSCLNGCEQKPGSCSENS